MTTLKLSDLFKRTGHNFEWTDRVTDQDDLIKRLKEFPSLVEYATELEDFAGRGIASLLFIEYILEHVTKTCSEKNIPIV